MLERLDRQDLSRLSAANQEARDGATMGGHFNSLEATEEILTDVTRQADDIKKWVELMLAGLARLDNLRDSFRELEQNKQLSG